MCDQRGGQKVINLALAMDVVWPAAAKWQPARLQAISILPGVPRPLARLYCIKIKRREVPRSPVKIYVDNLVACALNALTHFQFQAPGYFEEIRDEHRPSR